MHDPVHEAELLRQRMQEARGQLHQDVGVLVDEARGLFDWRRSVKNHPWLAVGTAAAIGFLLVRRRDRATRLDPQTLADLARQDRLVLHLGREADKPGGVVEALVATVLAVAGREATGWLSKQVSGLFQGDGSDRRSPLRQDPDPPLHG